jgi:hypothetical protein
LINKPYPYISLKYIPSGLDVVTPGQADHIPEPRQRVNLLSAALTPSEILSLGEVCPVSKK